MTIIHKTLNLKIRTIVRTLLLKLNLANIYGFPLSVEFATVARSTKHEHSSDSLLKICLLLSAV